MLTIKPIHEEDWETALSVLGKGFEHNNRRFWQRGLERHQMVSPEHFHWPIGHLLWDGDVAVGVMLAFRSKRIDEEGKECAVTNLSSWFVEEDYRWYAPFMMKKVSRDRDVIYTDLTPLDSVEEILKKFRWKPFNGGIAFFSVAHGLAFWKSNVRVVNFDPAASYNLPTHEHDLLTDHAKVGCLTAVLHLDNEVHPLVFVRQSYRFIPYIGLAYARDRAVVLKHMPSISRYLCKRGQFLAGIDCFRDEVPFGGFFLDRRNTVKYHTGPPDQKGVDRAYSELVLLLA